MNPPALAAAFAVGVVVAIGLFVVVATYNDVVALQRRIEKAWANIEVSLQQRFDQLPALVDAVRGVMAFERDVLTEVSEARARYSPTAPIPDQAVTAAATTRAVRFLFATVPSAGAHAAAAPAQVAARGQGQFVLGLVGGALAICSAMVLAVMIQGGLR